MTLSLLCRTEEVAENEIKQFTLNGIELLVINQNMKFYCLAARCTHAGAPLAEGELENGVLQCPWHGSRFRIETGEVVRGPAKKQLPIYYITVKDNNLLVEL
ncbi:MAG: Rieske 2Fe-2S domain-containing protein [Candidatus Bathyarchaeia archaeon]|jgi:nitrite reductase/ring-hydroxylating ferredoxin subunit